MKMFSAAALSALLVFGSYTEVSAKTTKRKTTVAKKVRTTTAPKKTTPATTSTLASTPTTSSVALRVSVPCSFKAEPDQPTEKVDFRGYLPTSGVVLISGGFMSLSRLAVVDFDAQTVSFAFGKRRGELAPIGPCRTVKLTADELTQLQAFVKSIVQNNEKCKNPEAIADFNVEGELSFDGKQSSFICYGPPQGTFEKLYSSTWEISTK